MPKFKLISKKCSRCQNEFYTTHVAGNIICPFCGYSFESAELVRRGAIREETEKECIIENGFGKISVKTVDVSKNGLGIKRVGQLPFSNEGSIVKISVDELGMNHNALVIWVKNSNEISSRAGLRFISPPE